MQVLKVFLTKSDFFSEIWLFCAAFSLNLFCFSPPERSPDGTGERPCPIRLRGCIPLPLFLLRCSLRSRACWCDKPLVFSPESRQKKAAHSDVGRSCGIIHGYARIRNPYLPRFLIYSLIEQTSYIFPCK